MVIRIKFPLVVAVFLLTRHVIHVSFPVKGITFGIDDGTTGGSNHFFGAFETLSWATEVHRTLVSLFRPLVLARIRLAEWFSDMRGILTFFNVIELICES